MHTLTSTHIHSIYLHQHCRTVKHRTHAHPPHVDVLTVMLSGPSLITSFTVSVKRRTSPTVRSKFSTREMLVRPSICSITFAYGQILHIADHIQSKIVTGVQRNSMCIAATCQSPLTAGQRFPIMTERSHNV